MFPIVTGQMCSIRQCAIADYIARKFRQDGVAS